MLDTAADPLAGNGRGGQPKKLRPAEAASKPPNRAAGAFSGRSGGATACRSSRALALALRASRNRAAAAGRSLAAIGFSLADRVRNFTVVKAIDLLRAATLLPRCGHAYNEPNVFVVRKQSVAFEHPRISQTNTNGLLILSGL